MCTCCRYCDDCPRGVPVPKLMEAYNHYMLSGDSKAILSRLSGHWGIRADDERLRACVECGRCEELCTQKLPIRERLRKIREEADRA